MCLICCLLNSCSWNQKDEEQSTNPNPANVNTQIAEIKIVDPFIDNEIDYLQELSYSKFDKNKKRKKNAKHTGNKLTGQLLKDQNLNKKNQRKLNKFTTQELDLIRYDSGLKCQILRNGPTNSPLPKKGQIVCTHYIGWHDDHGQPGELIDSTYERNLPFSFKIGENKVIKAWDEAVMDMRVGDKRRLFIPSELAWGKAGATKLIPGSTDLIYEIEIISIK